MADEAVLDIGAELESEGAEEVEQGAEAEVEGAEQAESVDGEPASAASTWKQLKDKLKDSPDLHRDVKKALHHWKETRKLLPDGVAKTVERLKLMEQLDDNTDDAEYVPGSTPIEQVISNTLAERSFWRDYDNAFQASDPKLINQMVEANPESFQKLAPLAMDRLADVNPEDFSTYICKSVSGYLVNAGIPRQLDILELVLPQQSDDPSLQRVVEAFKAIKGVVEQINTTAKRPMAPKSIQGQQPDTKTGTESGNLERREMNVLHDEWLREIRPRSESFTVNEIKKIVPSVKFTPAEANTIRNAVREEINARVTANTAYQGKIKSLLKAKNKTSYSMTVESEHKKIIPGAVKRAVDDVLAKRKAGQGRKAAPGASRTQQRASQAQQQTDNNKFEWISDSPTRLGLKVDFRRGGIQADNTAYIVGRAKPVKWKRK
ncbi:MAG: hypothetical protein WCA89_12220 [Terracidiphilus sp.]|jgi:hypothetical protein